MARRGQSSSNFPDFGAGVSHDDLDDFEAFRIRLEAENFKRMLDHIVNFTDFQDPNFMALLESVAKIETLNVLVVTSDENHTIICVYISTPQTRYKFMKSKNRLYGFGENKENDNGSKDDRDPFKFDED